MARIAKGWKLVLRGRIYRVRFTYAGRRYEITTGKTDPAEAAIVAGQVYADVVSGRVTVSNTGALVHPSTPLAELVADWIAAIEPELGRDTAETYTVYGKHWSKFFKNIGAVATGNISNYGRARLSTVRRGTVQKEIGGLRRFLQWALEQGIIRAIPEIKSLPKKVLGTKHPQGRPSATHLALPQVEAIFAALPELSRMKKGKRWVIRDRFIFAFETALRPEALDRLEERDLTVFGLHIRPELDKNRWERTVPLSPRAKAILESLVTGDPSKPFFGVHDRRAVWHAACVEALGEDGKRVNPYDLKHARVTSWLASGKNPMGVRFLTGTDEAIEKYAHPNRTAADTVFSELWGDSGAPPDPDGAKGGTRTLTGVTPLAPQASSGTTEGREKPPESRGESATAGIEIALSGAPPQIDPEEFRRRSAAWFRSVG